MKEDYELFDWKKNQNFFLHRKIFFRAHQSWGVADFGWFWAKSPYKLSLVYKGNRRVANKIELGKYFLARFFFWQKFSPPRRAHRLHFRYFRAPTDVCGANGVTLNSIPPLLQAVSGNRLQIEFPIQHKVTWDGAYDANGNSQSSKDYRYCSKTFSIAITLTGAKYP